MKSRIPNFSFTLPAALLLLVGVLADGAEIVQPESKSVSNQDTNYVAIPSKTENGPAGANNDVNTDMLLRNLDLFQSEDQEKLVQHIDQNIQAQNQRHILIRRRQGFGSACRDNDDCSQGFSCQYTNLPLRIQRRCLMSTDSCMAKATETFVSNFDSVAWKDQVLDAAGISSPDELIDEAVDANQQEEPELSPRMQNLMMAAELSFPQEQTETLQTAVNLCSSVAEEQGGPGIILYYGLHLELSTFIDLAWSLFWVGDNNTGAVAFNRLTFGMEIGSGAELSFLLGFAFHANITDFEGGAIVADVDAVPIVTQAGAAVVFSLNGLVSLELTFGLGTGSGLGVGYSQTSRIGQNLGYLLDDIVSRPTSTQEEENPNTRG